MITIPRLSWPYQIETGANDEFKVTRTTAANVTATVTGTLADGEVIYPNELAADVAAALNTADPASVENGGAIEYTASLSDAGTFSLLVAGVKANSTITAATTTSNAQELSLLLGFSSSATTSTTLTGGATSGTITAPGRMRQIWSPDVPVVSDTKEEYEAIVSVARTATGIAKHTRFGAPIKTRTLRFGFLQPARVFESRATDSDANGSLETLWKSDAVSRLIFVPDRSAWDDRAFTCFLMQDSLEEFRPERYSPALEVYSIELRLGEYVS